MATDAKGRKGVDTEYRPTSNTSDSGIDELVGRVAIAADRLFSAGDLERTLQRVVDVAVDTIEGCDFAGIFLGKEAVARTPVHSDSIVVEIDALQRTTGEGPSLDVLSVEGSVFSTELADDGRWPRFGPLADAAGIRSAFAAHLQGDGEHGALNLYARYPAAFGVVDRANGLLLAQLAGAALSTAHTHDNELRRATNLEAALVTRELIGRAEGILMERERVTSEQAFELLRRASQRLNVKLRDVAQNLVDTGTMTEHPPNH